MRPSSWASAAAAAALAALAAGGCDTTTCNVDPDANPPTDFRGGRVVQDASGSKLYETSAPDGQHLNFSAGARYRVFHNLGARPMLVQPWVSFSTTGVKGGNEAVPAGNMVEILEINSEYIQVRNDSCGDYWLRLVAAFPEPGGA